MTTPTTLRLAAFVFVVIECRKFAEALRGVVVEERHHFPAQGKGKPVSAGGNGRDPSQFSDRFVEEVENLDERLGGISRELDFHLRRFGTFPLSAECTDESCDRCAEVPNVSGDVVGHDYSDLSVSGYSEGSGPGEGVSADSPEPGPVTR